MAFLLPQLARAMDFSLPRLPRAMDFLFHYSFLAKYGVLDWVCCGTSVLSLVPTLWGAIRAWRTGELGAGARRPEPNLAALAANLCWFAFGCTEGQLEPFVLNAVGGIVQVVTLCVFFRLSAADVRAELLLTPTAMAFIPLSLTMAVGIAHIELVIYQCLCAVAGMLAAAAPLFTYFCLLDHPTAEHLPPHWELVGYMVHGSLWCARAWTLHPRNNYMLCQNAFGVLFSWLLLCVRLCLPIIEEEPQGLQGPLLGEQPEEIPAVPAQVLFVPADIPAPLLVYFVPVEVPEGMPAWPAAAADH